MDPLLVGTAVDLGLKLFGMHRQDQADKRAQELQEQALQLSEKEYYARQQAKQAWNEKYGSVEHNLLQYVKGLDASTLYGRMEGGINRSFENARKNMDSHLADRGFDVAGGVHAEMFANLADQELQTKLDYQQKAEEYVASKQQQLLNSNPQPNEPSTADMQNNLMNQGRLGQQRAEHLNAGMEDITKTVGQYTGYNKGTRDKQNRGIEKAKQNLQSDPTAKEVSKRGVTG